MIAKMKNIYLYTRYERLGHWIQMLFILILLISGFEIHDQYDFMGFQSAVKMHNYIGLAWLIAFAFFTFWVFTTGEWRQYLPTTRKMLSVVLYYCYGIFKGEPHPVPKRKEAKHNPLQRLVYLSVAAFLLPVQMASGFLYWGYNSWEAWGLNFLSLKLVAFVHIAGAFAILNFLIVHIYMTTTGHYFFAHIKAMITGWEEVEESVTIEDWEKGHKREYSTR